jgi:ParB family chromosome partitioning protein
MARKVDLTNAFSYLQARREAQAEGQRDHLGPAVRETTGEQGQVRSLAVDQLSGDPAQPRQTFPEESLAELAESIRTRGVLQPILVRPSGAGRYRIVAGERRYRAARLAGLDEVPCLVREFSDDEALAVGLIENVHREDLTDIDKSDALRRLKDLTGQGWEEIARAVHLSHVRVRTLASLQTLAVPVKEAIRARRVAGRVARVLKPLPEPLQVELLEEAVAEGLTAEEVQERARTRSGDDVCSPRDTKRIALATERHALALTRSLERERHALTPAQRARLRELLTEALQALDNEQWR